MVSPKIAQEFVTKTIIPKVDEIIKSGNITAVQKLLEKKKIVWTING